MIRVHIWNHGELSIDYIHGQMHPFKYTPPLTPILNNDNIYPGAKLDLLNKIQRIQNRCLCVCLRAPPRTSIMDLHKEAKVNLLVDRRASNLLKLAYKRKDLEPYRDTRQLPTRGHDVATMNKVPQPHNTLFMKSVLYRSALAWNALPLKLRPLIPTLNLNTNRKLFLGPNWFKQTATSTSITTINLS